MPSLNGFVEAISLLDGDAIGKEDKEKLLSGNTVTLMSLHSSKGLEFPVVFWSGWRRAFCPIKNPSI